MTESIRWLHLTDLHVGMKDQNWLWPRLKDDFLKSLEVLYANAGPWDLVLFTGDLSQRGDPKEYKKLDEIFGEMWRCFKKHLGCNPKLLAVPGNHDLKRPKKDSAHVGILEDWFTPKKNVPELFWDEKKNNQYRKKWSVRFPALRTGGKKRRSDPEAALRMVCSPVIFHIRSRKMGYDSALSV